MRSDADECRKCCGCLLRVLDELELWEEGFEGIHRRKIRGYLLLWTARAWMRGGGGG